MVGAILLEREFISEADMNVATIINVLHKFDLWQAQHCFREANLDLGAQLAHYALAIDTCAIWVECTSPVTVKLL